MNSLHLESYTEKNEELDKYLSDSIVSYGLAQLQGNEPKKLFCCFRNNENEIVAGIMGSATLNMFFISHLFVETDYRNNGLGAKLLAAIEKSALEAECDILRLYTFNKKAHDLYLRAGFEETTCIPNYMNGFDLVYYHKKITSNQHSQSV